MIETTSWQIGWLTLSSADYGVRMLSEVARAPGRRGGYAAIPGRPGRYAAELVHDQRIVPLKIWLKGDSGSALQSNLDALMDVLAYDEVQWLRRTMADGTTRRLPVRALNVIGFKPTSHLSAEGVVEFVSAEPYWEEEDARFESGHATSLPHQVTLTLGGNAPVFDMEIGIQMSGGTVTNPRISLVDDSGNYVQWTGTVADGDTLAILCGEFAVNNAGTVEYGNLESGGDVRSLLPLDGEVVTLQIDGTLSGGSLDWFFMWRGKWY